MVQGLKLIWRMLTGDSLWGKWIKSNLLGKKSFWEISNITKKGSWIWRKLLKLREVAKSFHMKAVGNGRHISFSYDRWSNFGVLSDLLGERGVIDMGVRSEATLEEVLLNPRRRKRHRRVLLQEIENELICLQGNYCEEERDVDLWRWSSGYKPKFSTQETWKMTRVSGVQVTWGRSVWFSQATPKFAFLTWLAMRNRLATMDRVSCWNPGVDTICVLCKGAPESRSHLFFECPFASQIWEQLVRGILQNSFSVT